jgi:protein-glutamine gamma-glutamyltransferase
MLALIASGLLEAVLADGELVVSRYLIVLTVQSALVGAAIVVLRRIQVTRASVPVWLAPAILAASALPVLIGFAGSFWSVSPDPLEVVLLLCLRNFVLALAGASVWPQYRCAAAGLSVFLAIFSLSMSNDPCVLFGLGMYSLAGIWWLMTGYWGTLSGRLHASSSNGLPRRWLLVIPCAVLGTVLLTGLNHGDATTALRGFMPTSGGTQWYDESARGGVNDGDALVAAQQTASSFGPVETDVFLDSEQPSLYDAFDEQYGEPFKPNSERSVALPSSLVKESQQQMAQAKQAHREFSTLRQQPTQRSSIDDTETDALFFVAGRTPLHLRVEEYDLFDGINWFPSTERQGERLLTIRKRNDEPWLQLDETSEDPGIFTGTASHALKTVALKGNRLPLPDHATELHIDRVDRPDMFAWVQDRTLRLQRESIPSLIVIHTKSLVADQEKLSQLSELRFLRSSQNDAELAVPEDYSHSQLARLAARWGEGQPRGWRQIEAVVDQLRSQCRLDPKHVVDSDSVCPTATFLLKDRCGPDYLFASAAAVLLRSLEYPTRLVSGFYAAPDKYDSLRRHTPVGQEDVHFWCEVYVGGGVWLTVEPTPGYDILQPEPTLWQRVRAACVTAWQWVRSHWVMLISALLLVIGLKRSGVARAVRIASLDAFYTLMWRVRCRDSRSLVRSTLWLMRRRCGLVGCERLRRESDREFFTRILNPAALAGDSDRAWIDARSVDRWLRYVEWSLFAPDTMPSHAADLRYGVPVSLEPVLMRETCHAIAGSVTTGSLRQIQSKHSVEEPMR